MEVCFHGRILSVSSVSSDEVSCGIWHVDYFLPSDSPPLLGVHSRRLIFSINDSSVSPRYRLDTTMPEV